jgi:hypothetical protein
MDVVSSFVSTEQRIQDLNLSIIPKAINYWKSIGEGAVDILDVSKAPEIDESEDQIAFLEVFFSPGAPPEIHQVNQS